MQQLLLALRFYATGCFYIQAGDYAGTYKTTAGRIVDRVTKAIITLRPNYITLPSTENDMQEVQRKFHVLARFPKVVGAIDGTHIQIQSPGKSTTVISFTTGIN